MITRMMNADEASIKEAGELIRQGEVVGFPTETVYGLGADALNECAVLKIFAAKDRPADNPLIVHINRLDQVDELTQGDIPEIVYPLAQAFWPGPLTMVMKKSPAVPDAVTASLSTVGIRMPSHPVARALIDAAKRPIAAPSANLSGRPSPTTAGHVLLDMDGRIPMILDGGACAVGLESTVLDVTCFPPKVLRPGGVTPEMIAAVVGEVEVDHSVLRPLGEAEKPSSPGMKYKHYAPKGELSIVSGGERQVIAKICELYDAEEAEGKSVAILALNEHAPSYGARRVHPLGATAAEAASNFFSVLREMDALGVDVMLAESVEAEGIGLALMNRMLRAAAFRIIQVEG